MIAAHSRRADYELKSKFVFAKSHGCSENSPNYRRQFSPSRNSKKERERENKWHEVFYALQREGHTPDSAARIATSRYGPHSDKERTVADHARTYEHRYASQLSEEEIAERDKKAAAAKTRIKKLESKPSLTEEEEYELALQYDELNVNRIRPEARHLYGSTSKRFEPEYDFDNKIYRVKDNKEKTLLSASDLGLLGEGKSAFSRGDAEEIAETLNEGE